MKVNETTTLDTEVTLSGRIVSMRVMGGSLFFDLRDSTGKIQIFVRRQDVHNFAEIKQCIIGSIVTITGTTFNTVAGEFSVRATNIDVLVIPKIPFPVGKRTEDSSYHSINDIEVRYRQRYLDLWSNLENREIFKFRSEMTFKFRQWLHSNGYMEIEAPILEKTPSGASAETFVTHYNSQDSDYHLRIALEIPLKKMIIAGFEKVYEIGKVFRNEGVSARHNPEFTMIEIYTAYSTLEDMKTLIVNLVDQVDSDIAEAISNALEVNYGEETNVGWEFVVNHPSSISPLAKSREDGTAYRFELAYNGLELANAYWEQNDPDLQRLAFSSQTLEQDGDALYASDEEFITAMQYGMPPCSGVGLGLDRLMMVLRDLKSIKDGILFPVS